MAPSKKQQDEERKKAEAKAKKTRAEKEASPPAKKKSHVADDDDNAEERAAEVLARAFNAGLNHRINEEKDQADLPAGHTHLFRLPHIVRTEADHLKDVDSVPFFRPSKEFKVTSEGHFAVRCRAAFSHSVAMYRNERGYVRALLHCAAKIVFFRCPGRFPVLIVSQIGNAPVKTDMSESLQGSCLRRMQLVEHKSKRTLTLDATTHADKSAEARELWLMYGSQDGITKAETLCSTLKRPPAGGVPAKRTGWLGTGFNLLARGHPLPTPDDSEDASSTDFDDVRFRIKPSYIKDVIAATASLTNEEAARIKQHVPVTLIPMTQIEDYDEKLETHTLTLRWKEQVDVQAMHAACIKLQLDARTNAFSYPITYGNVRVTTMTPITHDLVKTIRDILGDTRKVLVIPDVHLPKPERGVAWQAKRTLFVPGQKALPKSPIRRVMQTTGTVPWKHMVELAKQMRCVMVDCEDKYTYGPMSFVVEFEEGERAWVEELESGPTEIAVGRRLVQLHVLPPHAQV